MKTRFRLCFLAVVCSLVAPAGFAQNPNAAEKAAAASSDVNNFVFSAGTGTTPFITVVGTHIKPPGGKDLFITFFAVTAVLAQSINNDLPFAPFASTLEDVAIQCRCQLDGTTVPIVPSLPPDAPLNIITLDNMIRQTDRFTPGQVDFLTLVTQEGGTRGYVWTARDVGVGDHAVDVQCRFNFANLRFPFFNTFSAIAALIGPKQLQVEEVMLDAN